MSQTYKLNHIEDDIIKNIYIFSNDGSIKAPEYNDSNDNPIFSLEELQNITKKNIPVKIISTTVLHGDDTIGMVKKKNCSRFGIRNFYKRNVFIRNNKN